MAGHFSISENYISNYFKRNMGITVKRYIDHYRMGLIQNQLTYSNLTIKKIAYDFGFSDESHLNKIFKKYWNMSAKAFREIKKKDLQTQ
ncbi:helix-turn-helix transcriptional regulator [Fulvivirga maritima]|uniref:helix-turn-helix domain-containing protein n=1 Tax=Fulvivirga maritima TaxID=2904247 RepID=UPI001F18AE4C|nr:helix-turn-helix transcriptional regulator [Fulvivirga maritima]UII26370.1 helix-turn-helix transcriptional regulator [Fulvivirga maritima]